MTQPPSQADLRVQIQSVFTGLLNNRKTVMTVLHVDCGSAYDTLRTWTLPLVIKLVVWCVEYNSSYGWSDDLSDATNKSDQYLYRTETQFSESKNTEKSPITETY